MHVEYPAVDDARTRFRYLLPDSAYYPADRYHRQRVAGGCGCFSSELADDARADHRNDGVCGTRSTASLPTVVSDAATDAAQRHRHLHGSAHQPADAHDQLYSRLWRPPHVVLLAHFALALSSLLDTLSFDPLPS